MDNPELKLNIGVYERESSDLTLRYINSFNTSENNIITYETEDACIKSITDGITVLCAIFSEDFEIRDDAKNQLTFYVDESRINLADRLISSFSTTLGTESSDISEELAQQLLRIIEVTSVKATESLAITIANRVSIQKTKEELVATDKSVSGMDTATESINLRTLKSRASDIEKDYTELWTNAIKLYDSVRKTDFANDSDVSDAISKLNKTITTTDALRRIDDLSKAIDSLSGSIDRLQERLEKAGTVQSQVIKNIEETKKETNKISANTESLKEKQEEILSEISAFELRSARSITNPVNTLIESVSSTNTRLTYSFSYLLTLAILFVGIMLSSTIVFMEKDSKAYFRNFTTPTTQTYMTLINYLTAIFIIVQQTILILLIAHFTLSVPILTNLLVTSIILFLGITLFITIGLLIGVMSTTSEALTMSNLIIGSIFLFLSNLIIPLETLSPLISKIATFNPYVIVSEGIRKAMLFQANFSNLVFELTMLIIYIIILIIAMILIHKLGFKKYFASRRHKKNLLITEPHNLLLEIDHQKKKIKNIPELTDFLKTIDEEKYKEITQKNNPISEWLSNNLKKKILAIRIKRKNLVKTIRILEKHQNKVDKKNKRKTRKQKIQQQETKQQEK